MHPKCYSIKEIRPYYQLDWCEGYIEKETNLCLALILVFKFGCYHKQPKRWVQRQEKLSVMWEWDQNVKQK